MSYNDELAFDAIQHSIDIILQTAAKELWKHVDGCQVFETLECIHDSITDELNPLTTGLRSDDRDLELEPRYLAATNAMKAAGIPDAEKYGVKVLSKYNSELFTPFVREVNHLKALGGVNE